MNVKTALAALVGVMVLTTTSAQAEITMFEPVKKSMEDLLNGDYSIGNFAIGNDGDYRFVLYSKHGETTILCVLRSTPVNKQTISKCVRLN